MVGCQSSCSVDAFARLIAGWECSLSKETAFVERAIRQAAALRARQGHPISGQAIHHSDAGSQPGYTAGLFRAACERLRISQSMGRPGSALDNAVIESWHSTLEFELRRAEHFATRAAARAGVAAAGPRES